MKVIWGVLQLKSKSQSISLIITITIVIIGIIIDIYNKKENVLANTNINHYSYSVLTNEDIIKKHMEENYPTYKFYSKMFGISLDNLENALIDEANLEQRNLLAEDNEFDKELLNFIINLEKEKPELFNREYYYEVKSKEYIYGLVEYFVSIYDNVDLDIAKAICYLESGNLNAKSMLKKNNIFGGMKNGKIIKYSSIEYGVFKYISLLSNSYYGKGLNTVETIGKKYNPLVVNGKSVANPDWVRNVKSIQKKFSSEVSIKSIDKLLELENNNAGAI